MKLLPTDPASRFALLTGVLVAAAIVITSALFDLPALAAAVFPGLWVVLQARRGRCTPRARPHSAP